MRTTIVAALLLSSVCLPARAHAPITPWVRTAQTDQNQCQPFQVKDTNGNCQDAPGVFRPGPGYAMGPSDVCWAECECTEGAAPAADNCAPCSYVGQVCMRH